MAEDGPTLDVGCGALVGLRRQQAARCTLLVLGPPHLVSRASQHCSAWAYFTYGNERSSAVPTSTIQIQRHQPGSHQHDLAADLFAMVHPFNLASEWLTTFMRP